ncbi:MAG: Sir2 family NAD-dependent protein deacetylase [Polyangiaceae bacterium]
MDRASIDAAAKAIRDADALVFTAGAGMGVDSGLPDFRGNEGFWRAYPPFAKLGLGFTSLANPRWFADDPGLAWGFYGHRLHLYRSTVPHAGFAILLRWARSKPGGAHVFTSNVDGQFQRAGFADDRVFEAHGSIHHLQCARRCPGIWSADAERVDVDPETMRAAEPHPRCRTCGAIARPNILMFGDFQFDEARHDEQQRRYVEFLGAHRGKRLAVVECGAGTAVPTVRAQGEQLAMRLGATLVRLNPREFDVPAGQIGISTGARAGLEAIDAALG